MYLHIVLLFWNAIAYALCYSVFMFLICCVCWTGEHDLQLVLEEVHQITSIEKLGLNLGLHISAIDILRDQYRSPEEQKTRILLYWLQRKDIVPHKQSSIPTWGVLADAVARESIVLSCEIRAKYCELSPHAVFTVYQKGLTANYTYVSRIYCWSTARSEASKILLSKK